MRPSRGSRPRRRARAHASPGRPQQSAPAQPERPRHQPRSLAPSWFPSSSLVDWPAMPIYEYRCPNGHTFEVLQRMSDRPVTACETCGASPVEKLLFPVAVHFKGSGFYSTDYGRGSRKSSAKDAEAGSSSSDGSGKTDTTAASSDTKKSDAKSE